MEEFNYQFTALRGMQAGREYYLVMCPLKLIPKIFLFDEDELPAELRAQRVLNRARVPEIARYVVDNPTEYVFSAITASIDGDVRFAPIGDEGHRRNVGMLTVPMTARFLINDGQHRRAAIEEALKENHRLGDETIAVVFFIDAGLERSQQMFADLNKHAVRPTRSIGILYDHRDDTAQLARELAERVPIFRGLTDMEHTTISNRSTKLFTLSAIHQATLALLGIATKKQLVGAAERTLAERYWSRLCEVFPEWRLAIAREASPATLRTHYVHTHGVALHALGIAGCDLVAAYPDTWMQQLEQLATLDWRRTNRLWEGRAMHNGKMSKANQNLLLTANVIKQTLGLPLMATEAALETSLSPQPATRRSA